MYSRTYVRCSWPASRSVTNTSSRWQARRDPSSRQSSSAPSIATSVLALTLEERHAICDSLGEHPPPGWGTSARRSAAAGVATRLRALADRRRAEYDPRGFRAVGSFYCGGCRRARGNERGGCRARPNGRRAAPGGRLLLRLVRHAAAGRRMAPLGTGRVRAATGNRVDVLPVPRPVLVRRPGAPADAHARDRSDRHRHGGRVVVGTGVDRGRPSPTRRGRRAQRGTASGAARRAVGRPHAERRRRRAARATRARDSRRLRLRLDGATPTTRGARRSRGSEGG